MIDRLSSLRSAVPAFSSEKAAKPADSKRAYGVETLGVQNYLPIGQKRELTPEERQDIERNLGNWLPTLFPSYGTKASEMLADPVKTGVLQGGLTGTVTGGLAGGLQLLFAHGDFSGVTAAVAAGVGGLFGLISGVMSYFHREKENNDIIDLMKRLPPGATKRDLLADPVYQQDLQTQRLVTASGTSGRSGLLDTALTAGIVASVLDRRRD